MSVKIISQDQGMDVIELRNEHLVVRVTNFGATILNLCTPNREGQMVDVVMGYKTLEEYDGNSAYLGALVGRVANRIKNGTFTLNGTTYHLPINSGPNSLHGGVRGFSFRLFDYQLGENEVIFHYHAKDGEEGFPGNLDLTATYALKGASLILTYRATTDQDTLINITNHSYFNLEGHCTSIDDHILQIDATRFAPIDENGCVTGELREVEGTPFDFRKPTYIGDRIHEANHQLILGKGIDHPFILDCGNRQILLYSEKSGIALTVKTTCPQAQIYTANYFDGTIGKNDEAMTARCAVAIETQYMPDAIHNEANPSTILRAGEVYQESTSYTCEVKDKKMVR